MLDLFFKPKSIAVIGASQNKKKVGYGLVENLIKSGFRGKIYPINLKDKRILGLPALASVSQVKNKIDLAIIAIPAPVVPHVLKECGQKKIKNAIIISAGFKEINEEGAELENKIKDTAKKYRINFLGPNCLGILSSPNNLNASFAKGMIKKGRIAFISQSGALCTSLLNWSDSREIGYSHFISLGNKAVLEESDFLKFLVKDKDTGVIFCYLEELIKPLRFLRLAAKTAQIKPIFALKPGVSKKAQQAISSHTGAIAQERTVVETAFKQAGVVKLTDLQELFNLAKFYNRYEKLAGPRLAIITNAGGPGVITVDEIEESGLIINSLSPQSEKFLKNKLPKEANIKNPIDVIGDADAKRYEVALRQVSRDPNIDAIIVILTPQTMTQISQTAESIVKNSKKRPVLVSFVGGKAIAAGEKIFIKRKIPFFEFPNQAVKVLAQVWQAELAKEKAAQFFKNYKETKTLPKTNKTKQLKLFAAAKILKKYSLPLIKSVAVNSYREAQKQARLLGLPVVLKINSEKIVHKTEVGAVLTRLISDKEIKQAFLKLKKRFPREEIVIQPQPKGLELLLGFKRDDNFGLIFIFGLGGIYTEVLKDATLRLNSLDKKEILAMFKETRAYKLLTGYRHCVKVDLNDLANLFLRMVRLANENPQILEFDINPLIINDNLAKIVDIRIITTN
ncbi:MAG: acetate--CoA ligase family protein [bacterium]